MKSKIVFTLLFMMMCTLFLLSKSMENQEEKSDDDLDGFKDELRKMSNLFLKSESTEQKEISEHEEDDKWGEPDENYLQELANRRVVRRETEKREENLSEMFPNLDKKMVQQIISETKDSEQAFAKAESESEKIKQNLKNAIQLISNYSESKVNNLSVSTEIPDDILTNHNTQPKLISNDSGSKGNNLSILPEDEYDSEPLASSLNSSCDSKGKSYFSFNKDKAEEEEEEDSFTLVRVEKRRRRSDDDFEEEHGKGREKPDDVLDVFKDNRSKLKDALKQNIKITANGGAIPGLYIGGKRLSLLFNLKHNFITDFGHITYTNSKLRISINQECNLDNTMDFLGTYLDYILDIAKKSEVLPRQKFAKVGNHLLDEETKDVKKIGFDFTKQNFIRKALDKGTFYDIGDKIRNFCCGGPQKKSEENVQLPVLTCIPIRAFGRGKKSKENDDEDDLYIPDEEDEIYTKDEEAFTDYLSHYEMSEIPIPDLKVDDKKELENLNKSRKNSSIITTVEKHKDQNIHTESAVRDIKIPDLKVDDKKEFENLNKSSKNSSIITTIEKHSDQNVQSQSAVRDIKIPLFQVGDKKQCLFRPWGKHYVCTLENFDKYNGTWSVIWADKDDQDRDDHPESDFKDLQKRYDKRKYSNIVSKVALNTPHVGLEGMLRKDGVSTRFIIEKIYVKKNSKFKYQISYPYRLIPKNWISLDLERKKYSTTFGGEDDILHIFSSSSAEKILNAELEKSNASTNDTESMNNYSILFSGEKVKEENLDPQIKVNESCINNASEQEQKIASGDFFLTEENQFLSIRQKPKFHSSSRVKKIKTLSNNLGFYQSFI